MTRKDFILLSSAIHTAGERIRNDQTIEGLVKEGQLRGVRRAACHIADAIFEEQGNRFDVVRFLKDCGFSSTETGEAMHLHLEEKGLTRSGS